MLTLESGRLLLRDFVLTVREALNAMLADPSVTRFVHFASCFSFPDPDYHTSTSRDDGRLLSISFFAVWAMLLADDV